VNSLGVLTTSKPRGKGLCSKAAKARKQTPQPTPRRNYDRGAWR
jgi:hypothetical protein